MKKALIFAGGWDGHEPYAVADIFAKCLQDEGFVVDNCKGTDCLLDAEKLCEYDLIIPSMTMATIPSECTKNISTALKNGTGLAGCHGGMCDAFRNDTDWQFITGGQWVAHPGGDGVKYTVNICHGSSPIIDGIADFEVESEQYYLHIDPCVEVLATTRFPVCEGPHCTNKPVDMPVVWTKYWGKGKVFYCSLGHHADIFTKYPEAMEIMRRGMLWAAKK